MIRDLAVVLVQGCVVFAGCADGGEPCVTSRECIGGALCINGSCMIPPDASRDVGMDVSPDSSTRDSSPDVATDAVVLDASADVGSDASLPSDASMPLLRLYIFDGRFFSISETAIPPDSAAMFGADGPSGNGELVVLSDRFSYYDRSLTLRETLPHETLFGRTFDGMRSAASVTNGSPTLVQIQDADGVHDFFVDFFAREVTTDVGTMPYAEATGWDGPFAPTRPTTASWFHFGDEQGWITGSPATWCGHSLTEVFAYGAVLTNEAVHIYDSACLTFGETHPPGFGPLAVSGAPAFGEIVGASWNDGRLFLIAP